MTEHASSRSDDRANSDRRCAAAKFWQDCDRYHELAEHFTRDIAITHPKTISGRHRGCPGDTECCGWCRTGVTYYEHIPKARYSQDQWL